MDLEFYYVDVPLGAGLRTPPGAFRIELSLRDDLRGHLSIALGNHF